MLFVVLMALAKMSNAVGPSGAGIVPSRISCANCSACPAKSSVAFSIAICAITRIISSDGKMKVLLVNDFSTNNRKSVAKDMCVLSR